MCCKPLDKSFRPVLLDQSPLALYWFPFGIHSALPGRDSCLINAITDIEHSNRGAAGIMRCSQSGLCSEIQFESGVEGDCSFHTDLKTLQRGCVDTGIEAANPKDVLKDSHCCLVEK